MHNPNSSTIPQCAFFSALDYEEEEAVEEAIRRSLLEEGVNFYSISSIICNTCTVNYP